MSTLPPKSDVDGRDGKGRFGAGNRFSKGNPLAQRVAKLRAALIGAVTEADLRAVASAMLKKAKSGDVSAAKLLLSYTLGEPSAVDALARIEALEQAAGVSNVLPT